MNSRKLIPSIRLSEFTSDWEYHKFENDIISIQTGTNLLGSGINNGMPLIKMGNIQRGYFSFKKLEKLDENSKVSKHDIIKNGDFLFNTRNTLELVGKGATWFGKSGIYAFNSNIAKFTFNGINTFFFNYLYNTNQVIKQVRARAVGTTSVAAVYPRDLNSLRYYIPTIKEQSKIGTFFQEIDKVLTLEQQLINDHKQLKKAMLQKMFPQKGESVPRIRFAGFNGNWREKELSELAERFDNLRIPITSSERIAGSTPYYGANGIQGYIEGYTHDGEFILVAEDGANDLKNYPVQYVSGKVWVNNHAHVLSGISGTTDNYFLMNSIKQTNIEPFLLGGGRAKLNANIMMKIKFYIPDVIEQKKIGKFFKQLDETIALHENKLGTYQELKKAMLQKMFV